MGLLRFVLANLVMVSHLGYGMGEYHLGVMAVVIFYMLSGRVAMRRWLHFQVASISPIKDYYFDRIQRIYPQYLFALLCAILLWVSGVESEFLSKQPNVGNWLSNLLIMPLNLFMYFDIYKFTLVPPVWSLGAELQFMLILPILLITHRYVRIACLVLSAGIFLMAQLGELHTDNWGYRLLPGIFFIFYLGAVSNQLLTKQLTIKNLFLLCNAYVVALLYGLFLLLNGDYIAFRHEVMFGLIVGIPLIIFVRDVEKNYSKKWKNLDSLLGFLSYGIFLQHFNMMWFLNWSGSERTWIVLVAVFLGTYVLAFIGHYFLEKK